jgi:hypothetical protein
MKDHGVSRVTENTHPATLYNLISLIFTNIGKILDTRQPQGKLSGEGRQDFVYRE